MHDNTTTPRRASYEADSLDNGEAERPKCADRCAHGSVSTISFGNHARFSWCLLRSFWEKLVDESSSQAACYLAVYTPVGCWVGFYVLNTMKQPAWALYGYTRVAWTSSSTRDVWHSRWSTAVERFDWNISDWQGSSSKNSHPSMDVVSIVFHNKFYFIILNEICLAKRKQICQNVHITRQCCFPSQRGNHVPNCLFEHSCSSNWQTIFRSWYWGTWYLPLFLYE